VRIEQKVSASPAKADMGIPASRSAVDSEPQPMLRIATAAIPRGRGPQERIYRARGTAAVSVRQLARSELGRSSTFAVVISLVIVERNAGIGLDAPLRLQLNTQITMPMKNATREERLPANFRYAPLRPTWRRDAICRDGQKQTLFASPITSSALRV